MSYNSGQTRTTIIQFSFMMISNQLALLCLEKDTTHKSQIWVPGWSKFHQFKFQHVFNDHKFT